jgi:hypothetical protein
MTSTGENRSGQQDRQPQKNHESNPNRSGALSTVYLRHRADTGSKRQKI